ncbi:unnamed protein product [Adineta steineri]|uniref:Uncharacterized protein n=1 Tax=Adineta steineri TaxID=433720 RepID=A0A814ZJ71_9BILA|nr:unnamed protein product [Adineta steineri]CAF1243637.1 unnamed protein product [Adineta steineri]
MPTASSAAYGLYVPKPTNQQITYINVRPKVASYAQTPLAAAISTQWASSSSIQLVSSPSPTPTLTRGFWFWFPWCCALLTLLVGGCIAAAVLATRTQDTTTTTVTTTTASMTVATTTIATTTIATTTPVTTTTVTTTIATTTTVTTTLATTVLPTTTVAVPTAVLNNTCTAIMSGSTTVLLYLQDAAIFSYTYYTYTFVATATTTTMMLALRQDPNYWCLDDVSVQYNGVELWQDGGFESSPLTSYYTYCNPNGASASGTISTSCVHSGSYSFYDGSVTYSDYLSQSFATVIGGSYNISFWLSNLGGPTNSALVIIG